MRQFVYLTLALLVAISATGTALAQSSGNFTYGTNATSNTACVMDSKGVISGGVSSCSVSAGSSNFACTNDSDCTSILGSNSGATCVGGFCTLPNTGTAGCIGSVNAGIKTSSGSGNVFLARVSAVIGLLTDVTLSSKQTANATGTVSSSALAGIDFTVGACPQQGQALPTVTPNYTITFDSRFVQISSNLFSVLTTQCSALANGCFLSFAESTVSAHSFDWIIGSPTGGGSNCNGSALGGAALSSGQYGLTASWAASSGFGVAAGSIGEAAACVGPVNFTVQQNKIFSFNSVNSL
jgi:hypothetical protein